MAMNRERVALNREHPDELAQMVDDALRDWQKTGEAFTNPVLTLAQECDSFDDFLKRLPELQETLNADDFALQRRRCALRRVRWETLLMRETLIPKEALAWLKAKKLRPGLITGMYGGKSTGTASRWQKCCNWIVVGCESPCGRRPAKRADVQRVPEMLQPLLIKRGWWGVQEMDDPLTGETRTVQLGSDRRLRTILIPTCAPPARRASGTHSADKAGHAVSDVRAGAIP